MHAERRAFAQGRQLRMRQATRAQVIFRMHFEERRRRVVRHPCLEMLRLEADAGLRGQAGTARIAAGETGVRVGHQCAAIFIGWNAASWPWPVGEVLDTAVVVHVPAGTYIHWLAE